MENPKSRSEAILQNMLGEDNPLVPPKSRVEALLLELLNGGGGSQITIDTVVEEGSTNPVQNGAIWSFVNSSIATETAHFIGTFNSVADLEAYSGPLTNNDYAFVVSTDVSGNTLYNRYKYNDADDSWLFEYSLNNSSFTANQWATINSRLVYADKTKLDALAAVPEITGATTTTGSMTWSFTVTSDDATKLQGVREGAYTAILFTPIVDGVKKSMLLRRTSSSGTPEFTGICVDHYANNLLTMYYAAGITANNHIVVSKFELTGNFTPTAGTGISVNPSTKAISIADISGLGTGTEKLYTVGHNAQGQITSATEVTMGAGMTMTNNVLNTSIVGEILSETAYSQLATKDKDIYFTYD
jgi:hypothetical protein